MLISNLISLVKQLQECKRQVNCIVTSCGSPLAGKMAVDDISRVIPTFIWRWLLHMPMIFAVTV